MSKPLTVAALIKRLQKISDKKRIVVLAAFPLRDGPCPDVAVAHHVSTASYDRKHHEIGLEELTAADMKLGRTAEDVVDGQPALVLSP